jgi:hypothetical protein
MYSLTNLSSATYLEPLKSKGKVMNKEEKAKGYVTGHTEQGQSPEIQIALVLISY